MLGGEGQRWLFKGVWGVLGRKLLAQVCRPRPALGCPAPALLAQVSLLLQQISLPCDPGRAFLAGSVVLAPGWQAVDI